jgi:hypothetical protein
MTNLTGPAATTADTKDRLWIGTVKGLSFIDLQKPLPETVPADWLARRRVLRLPGEAVSMVGGLLFLPVAFEALRWWYILLLVLIIPVGFGIQEARREKNRTLLYGASVALLLILLGLVALWLTAAMLAMMN